jgi:UDP-N-acetylglucosamine:LPS N-acetylglucosamine transferase
MINSFTRRRERKRILAIASAGGHWQQLMSLRGSFADCDILFATTLKGLPEEFDAAPAVIIPECNRNSAWLIPWTGARLFVTLVRLRPDVVISTGALPGVIALSLAKLFRCRTIWVDSIANAEEMSMSGKLAKRFADLWLSQWPHVAQKSGAGYMGAIL